MAFEVKGNPNPHIPPTQVSNSTTQSMHSESSAAPPTTRVQRRERWREMGGEKWRKTVVQSSKSNITMLFLSPSASLTSCWSGRMSECHIFHLDNFSAFPLTSVFGISWQKWIIFQNPNIALDHYLTNGFWRAVAVENAEIGKWGKKRLLHYLECQNLGLPSA